MVIGAGRCRLSSQFVAVLNDRSVNCNEHYIAVIFAEDIDVSLRHMKTTEPLLQFSKFLVDGALT